MILEQHGETSLEIQFFSDILYWCYTYFFFFGAGRSMLVSCPRVPRGDCDHVNVRDLKVQSNN